MKHSGGVRHFLRENTFALCIAAAWLVLVWGFVLVGQAWFKEPLSLVAWAGSWDGGWYKGIVESGYYAGEINGQSNVAFFPLLPALTWLVSKVTLLPTVWAGMFVSSVSFAAALMALWHFVSKFFTPSTAKWTLLLVAFNPFSLYFGMFYTESLFLLLAVSAFWFVYEKQWWLAAFFAGLATATRSVGVAVAVAVIVGWIAERFRKPPVKPGWRTIEVARANTDNPKKVISKKKHTIKRPWSLWSWLVATLAIAALSFGGIAAFILYMWWHTGDAFAFSTVQQFWPGREAGNIGSEIVYLWEHKVINMEYLLTLMWYACTAFVIIGLALLARMHKWLLAMYAAIAVALPLAFGTAAAMNRYMLVVFPIFVAYAAVIAKLPAWLRGVIVAVGVAGLGFVTYLMIDPRHLFVG